MESYVQLLADLNVNQSQAIGLMYDLFYVNRNEVVEDKFMWQSMTTQLLLALSNISDEYLSNEPFLHEQFRVLFSIDGLYALGARVAKTQPNSEFVHYVTTLQKKNDEDAKQDHDRTTCHIIKTLNSQSFSDLLSKYLQVEELSKKLRRIDLLYDKTLISKQFDYEIWVMLRKLLLNFALFNQFTLDDFCQLESFTDFCSFIDKSMEKNLYFGLTTYIQRDYINVIKFTLGNEAAAHHERVFALLVEA